MSASTTGRRALGAALLLAAAALAPIAGCGHYGPPLRAEEYREKEKAEAAAEREQRRAEDEESPAEAPSLDEEGGNLSPDAGEDQPEGLEAP